MNNYTINNDKTKLDINVVHTFLTNSYWAKGRSIGQVLLSVENSDCYGVYSDGKQIGFARILTDYVTVAHLCDVFILEEFRGNGLAKELLTSILENPKYKNVLKWKLATRDAHKLYEKFGFIPITNPQNQMEKINKPF
jgi:GNAT superfamily N-acetyltransferase